MKVAELITAMREARDHGTPSAQHRLSRELGDAVVAAYPQHFKGPYCKLQVGPNEILEIVRASDTLNIATLHDTVTVQE